MISECTNYPDNYRYDDEGDPRIEDLTVEQAEGWQSYLQGEDEPMPLKQFLEMMEERDDV
jgi:hypothetical protein